MTFKFNYNNRPRHYGCVHDEETPRKIEGWFNGSTKELTETLRDLEAIERIPQEDPGYMQGVIDTIKNILGTDAPSRDEQVQKFYHDTEEYLKKLEKEAQQK